ncbi:NF-kappa-B inhibitor delta [Biomphalaria glabrata]|nr:NF-kappa-B inhibitor delta [Biomphalaria glabrata]
MIKSSCAKVEVRGNETKQVMKMSKGAIQCTKPGNLQSRGDNNLDEVAEILRSSFLNMQSDRTTPLNCHEDLEKNLDDPDLIDLDILEKLTIDPCLFVGQGSGHSGSRSEKKVEKSLKVFNKNAVSVEQVKENGADDDQEERYSSDDILTDIHAVITADTTNGKSEDSADGASVSASASANILNSFAKSLHTNSGARGGNAHAANGHATNGHVSPKGSVFWQTRAALEQNQDLTGELFDFRELEENSLKLSPSRDDLVDTPSVQSSEMTLDLENGDENQESRLVTLQYDSNPIDSLNDSDDPLYQSILIEKGKRGRPARQKVEKPATYIPILPRPTANGQLLIVRTSGSSVSSASPQTPDTNMTASSVSRDSSSSEKDVTQYQNGGAGASRNSSVDIDGPFNVKMNPISSSPNTSCMFPGNLITKTQEQPFVQLRPSNSAGNVMSWNHHYPSNSQGNESSYNGYHASYGGGAVMPQQYKPTTTASCMSSFAAPLQPWPEPPPYSIPNSGMQPNNFAAANQAVQQASSPYSGGLGPLGYNPQSLAQSNGASLYNPVNSQIFPFSSNTYFNTQTKTTGQECSSVVPLPAPPDPQYITSQHPSGASNFNPAYCSKIKTPLNPTRPNEKPKINLPHQKKINYVSDWISNHVADPPLDSGCFYTNDQSLASFQAPNPSNNFQVMGVFGEVFQIQTTEQEKPKKKVSKKVPTTQNGKSSQRNRATKRNDSGKSSSSTMLKSSYSHDQSNRIPQANGPERLCGNVVERTNELPFYPQGARDASGRHLVTSAATINETEKAISDADLEIALSIIEMKANSIEKHKAAGQPLVPESEPKQSSLDYILNSSAFLAAEPFVISAGGINGLPTSQLADSSSFDKSKYLTPNDINSLEAKKLQSGKTSLDDYLFTSQTGFNPSGTAQGSQEPNNPVYLGPTLVPTMNSKALAAPMVTENVSKSYSQMKPVITKLRSEEANTSSVAQKQSSHAPHFQVPSQARFSYVQNWINVNPVEQNAPLPLVSSQQCFNMSLGNSVVPPATSLSSQSQLAREFNSGWSNLQTAPTTTSRHPISSSDASMMSIENPDNATHDDNLYPQHFSNSSSMDVVDNVQATPGSALIQSSERMHSKTACSANADRQLPSMDDSCFSEIMSFLVPEISAISSNSRPQVQNSTTVDSRNSFQRNGNHEYFQGQINNAVHATSVQNFSTGTPGQYRSSQNVMSQAIQNTNDITFPLFSPGFDDDLILSPRGPSRTCEEKDRGKTPASIASASIGAASIAPPSIIDQQPAEITISSLESSKISGSSDLSKFSYSSLPEQMMGFDSDGETCLHFLCDMPLESLEEFKRQPGFREALDVQNKKRETALFIAVKRSNAEVTDFLLSCGANPNICCSSQIQGLGPIQHCALHEAVLTGNLKIVKSLLSAKNIVVDSKASYGGQTPLMLALALHKLNKNKDIILWLIEKKASLTIQELQGRTPLMLAIQSRDVALVESILHLVGPVMARTLVTAADKKGLTCLHIAAGLTLEPNEKKRLLQCIITAGGDASVKNAEGETPRDWAKNEITEVLQNLAKVNKTS